MLKRTRSVVRHGLFLVFTCVVLVCCEAELLHELSEAEATRLVVLLEENGVAARVESSRGRNTYAIVVAEGELSKARRVLVAHRLPVETDSADGDDEGGLLGASLSGAHHRQERSRAREIAASLRARDGIDDARVHLVLPQAGWSLDRGLETLGKDGRGARASVWLRGSEGDGGVIARFVAGSVPGLSVSAVEVQWEGGEEPGSGEVSEGGFERVGPWAVSVGSAGSLRWVLGGLVALVVLLMAGGAFRLLRLRARRS